MIGAGGCLEHSREEGSEASSRHDVIIGLPIIHGHVDNYKRVYHTSHIAQLVKNLPSVLGTWIRFLGLQDPLENKMANPLQYSCLENAIDRGTWQATVHRVARVGPDSMPSFLYHSLQKCIQAIYSLFSLH